MEGHRFGRWTVEAPANRLPYPSGQSHGAVFVRCDCGRELVVTLNSLRTGLSTSCGCYKAERTRDRSLRHGHNCRGKRSIEYRAWANMTGRRAGRCQRWIYGSDGRTGFETFLSDMGPAPFEHSAIRRRDASAPYSPDNCFWASFNRKEK